MGAGKQLSQGRGLRRGRHHQRIAVCVLHAELIAAGQAVLKVGRHAGIGKLRANSADQTAHWVEKHCGCGGITCGKVAHSLDDRIVDSVGEDQHADAGVVCIFAPSRVPGVARVRLPDCRCAQ